MNRKERRRWRERDVVPAACDYILHSIECSSHALVLYLLDMAGSDEEDIYDDGEAQTVSVKDRLQMFNNTNNNSNIMGVSNNSNVTDVTYYTK